jgi:hypothetical protein
VLPIYIKHTLETPKVVLLGLILGERECYMIAIHWCVVDTRKLVGTPQEQGYDEHNNKFSLSCETKVYRTSRRKPNFRRLMLASFATAPDNLYGASSRA